MADFYEMTIAGVKKKLPLCPLNENLDIAGFVIFGETEMTVSAVSELLKKTPEFDYILTAEAKGIPLGYEMSRQSGKKYFVARKGAKLYMQELFKVEVQSITTEKRQTLYLDKSEADEMSGKRILILDDVISTGESLKALEYLCVEIGAKVVAKAAVLAEGDAAKRDDIIFLEELPLFFK